MIPERREFKNPLWVYENCESLNVTGSHLYNRLPEFALGLDETNF